MRKYSLRPWSAAGHDMSPRCRNRVDGPAPAGAPAVLLLPRPTHCCPSHVWVQRKGHPMEMPPTIAFPPVALCTTST
eukprot:8652741-Pyramimonas_sp.AAC.1